MKHLAIPSALTVFTFGLLGGCPAATVPASFTAGTGGSDVGTINDGKGNEFLLTELAGGLRIDASGTDGDLSAELDSEGRVTHLERNKLTLDLSYNTDGSANATGEITARGETYPIDTLIPADQIPTGKTAGRSQGTICGLVDRFCNVLDAILVYLEAALLNEFGYQDNPDNDSFINLANTGVELAVGEAMRRITGPLEAFCAAWPEIRAEVCN